MDQNYLLALDESIKAENFQIIEGLIIIKNDKLIYENYYFNEFGRHTTKNIGSAGLSFALAAVGIALDKGLFSIDDPIANYLPSYSDRFSADPQKGAITIRHLLTHRSGISWNESSAFAAVNNTLIAMKNEQDWIGYVLDQPMEAPPGLRDNFNTASGIILARIIENTSGLDYQSFLLENLLEPLTITSLSIEQSPQGLYNGGDGYSLSLLDWTKLGYLFLNEGIWQGRKIIDPNFIDEAASVQYNIQANRTYGIEFENIGYVFALFGDQSLNRFGVDHDDIFYSFGRLGESLYMIPSEDMVIGILADNYFGFDFLSLNLLAEITYSIQQQQ